MLPLILTVLNRDDKSGYDNPTKDAYRVYRPSRASTVGLRQRV